MPSNPDNSYICGQCLDDDDLPDYIAEMGEMGPACFGCGRSNEAVISIRDLGDYMRARMDTFYSQAVNHLMYVTAEGGYLGWHVDTEELLFDYIGFSLVDENADELRSLLVSAIDSNGDAVWCDYSPGGQPFDDSLLSDWSLFVKLVKHNRRFFFQSLSDESDVLGDIVGQNLGSTLEDLAELVAETGLLRPLNPGMQYFRARPRMENESFTRASELGPPPPEDALQSNRMNPPGIPMFYGSTTPELAQAETRSKHVSIGSFEVTRKVAILDLVDLPPVPGFFSTADRRTRLGTRFLHKFADLISQPVPRNDRTNLDYVPTQILTEFLRDYSYGKTKLVGIAFKTATTTPGSNIVLFIDQSGVADPGGEASQTLLRLTGSHDT